MLNLQQVSLRYDLGPPALDAVSFDLPQGAFRWLLGPSGAGKTSLLRLLALAVRPTSGALRVLGVQVEVARRRDLPALRRRIGVVFQDFRLLPHLSAFDNVALPLRLAGRPEGQVRADAAEMLRWVGLAARADALPAALSGGEQQRVAIARAVVARPALLLADEPTGNLDDVQAGRLMQLLAELNRLGTSVVVATHNASLVARYPAPALVLQAGRLHEAAQGEAAGLSGERADGADGYAPDTGAGSGATEPGASVPTTEPGVSRRATDTGAGRRATEPGASVPATAPGVSRAATEQVASVPATEPGVSRGATEPGASVPATAPGVSRAATEKLATVLTTEPGVSRGATEPGASVHTTEPGVSRAATIPWSSAHSTDREAGGHVRQRGASDHATGPAANGDAAEPAAGRDETDRQASRDAAGGAPGAAMPDAAADWTAGLPRAAR